MNNKEKTAMAAVGVVGYYVGSFVTEFKHQYRGRKQKKTILHNSDFMKVFEAWMNDATDRRSLNDVVADWHFNHEFEKITKQK